jgi:hypothetical protein
MSSTDHTARASAWALMTEWSTSDGDDDAIAGCLLELRARVERLEQAQQPEPSEPSTPAGQGELVRSVALAIGQDGDAIMWKAEARRAILAVADWCDGRGMDGAADLLRQEVGR